MRRFLILIVLIATLPALAAPSLVLTEPQRGLYEAQFAPDVPESAAAKLENTYPDLQPPARVIQWSIDNLYRVDGWQLTGYSQAESLFSFDRGIRTSRWKIGFVGGECAATESLMSTTDGLVVDRQWEQHRRTNLEDYISLHVPRPEFGFHRIWEF